MTERAWDLRITARCLREDLGFGPYESARAEDHTDEHDLVRAFVERRGQQSIGQETFRCGTEVTGLPLFTLHFKDHRAATWHQTSVPPGFETEYPLGIVWLLGVRPEHDYDGLCDLGDDLLPTLADQQAFIADAAQTFARALVEEVPELLALAEANRGHVVTGSIANTIGVRLYRDRDDQAPLLTVAYSSRPLPNGATLLPRWQSRLVLAFFDTDEFADLAVTNDIGGRPLEPDESAYCSFAP